MLALPKPPRPDRLPGGGPPGLQPGLQMVDRSISHAIDTAGRVLDPGTKVKAIGDAAKPIVIGIVAIVAIITGAVLIGSKR